MALPTKKPRPLSPLARLVLDHLCKTPARVFDFTEIADALRVKRGDAQRAITELRHGGHTLAAKGPDGIPLRPRHAFLPPSAAVRAGYPALEHPDVPELPEHPSVTAVRRALEQKREEEEKARAKADARQGERAAKLHADKLGRKLAMAKHRIEYEAEEAAAVVHVPTVEEVVAAGYLPHIAAGVVAEQEALAAGADRESARQAGIEATEAFVKDSAPPPEPDAPWTSDADVSAALDDAPKAKRKPKKEQSTDG